MLQQRLHVFLIAIASAVTLGAPRGAHARDEWQWFRPAAEEPTMTDPADPVQPAAYVHFSWATTLDKVVQAAIACGDRSPGWASQIQSDLEMVETFRVRRWDKETTDPARWHDYINALFEWRRTSRRNLVAEDCRHLDDDALALAEESERRMRQELRAHFLRSGNPGR